MISREGCCADRRKPCSYHEGVQDALDVTTDSLLTYAEHHVIDLLADAFNKFVALPERHSTETSEFAAGVHTLQRQVMARAARRAYPDKFPNMTATAEASAFSHNPPSI